MRERKWWEHEWLMPVLSAVAWLLIAVSFGCVALSIWLL